MRLGFRNRRGKATSSEELTSIPEGVDDNKYLAASANAAVVDKNSGAYDRHLFGEREIATMPYEDAVDHHLDLVSLRLGQKFIRHISRARKTLLSATATRDRLALKRELYDRRLEELNAQLDEQEGILSGSRPGAHGLMWPGHAHDFHGRASAALRLATKPAIFLLVGLVDLVIIYLSFTNLKFGEVEAAFLTAPAVGAQLAFPHLAGARIGLLLRGPSDANKRKWSLAIEALTMLGVWFVFVLAISYIRLQFIASEYLKGGQAAPELLQNVFFAISTILMVALGGWLLFLAMRENEHETKALRLKLTIHNTRLAVWRLEKRVSRIDQRVSLANETLSAFVEERENALLASRQSLGDAAKAVYRRALINQEGDPEFTSSYFGVPDRTIERPDDA
ncbi:hypothetical protein N9F59_00070 [Aquiluna sp.]|nr:hypothetical protein [Aquiluna sp.]MDA8992680.1 hypothetical protein [Aquiluna sp.]